MKRRTKLILTAILSVLCAVFFSVGCDGCGCSCGEVSSVFSTFTDTVEFDADYTLTADDVKATNGENSVVVSKPIAIKLNGHALDLNGYTLDIEFDSEGVVSFQGGEIKNGTLKVIVPNGDIEFDSVSLAEDVTSDLHAASDTIRFSNAKISGKSTIKSNTNVEIKYSSVEDITLVGNATLSAKSGAKLGSLTVSDTATNAKVEVSEKASVSTVALKAPVEAKISGSVSAITVASTAKNTKVEVAKTAEVKSVEINAPVEAKINGSVNEFTVSETAKSVAEDSFSIEISSSASVSKLELKSAASVDISGKVTKLNVAESASDNTNNFAIKVKEDAQITQVSLSAKTDIEISGEVAQMVVEETAQGASINFTETASSEVAIVVKAEDTKIDSQNEIKVHVVDTVQNVQLGEEITKKDITAAEVGEIIKHVHVWIIKSSTEPTCTEAGEIVYDCEDCDETKTKSVPALGHDWEYKVIEEPTETKAGKSVRTCRRCGEREEISVKALDSIAVKGLNAIAELIGDNSYTINVKGGVTASDVGSVAKVNDIQLIVNSKDGKLSGSLEVDMTVMTKESDKDGVVIGKEDILVKGKLENECLTAYVAYGDEEAWAKIPVEFLIETLAGEFLGEGYSQMLTSYLNAENFNKVEKVAKNIAEKLNDKLVLKTEAFTQVERNILGLLFKTTVDGDNTTYAYDKETIDAIGEMKVVEVINAILGENAYADLKTFITASLDKTAFEAFTGLMSFAVDHNLTAEDVIDILTIIKESVPQLAESEMDIVAMFTQFKDMKVSEILVGVLHCEDADEVKTAIAGILAMADQAVDANVSTYVEMIPAKYVNMAAMVQQMVDMYAENISFTLDKDNKLVAYEVKLATPSAEVVGEEMAAEMPKIDFTFSWKQNENIVLDFDVDVMGVKASFKDIENGKELKVNVFNEADIDVKLLSEKDGEYEIKYDLIGENFAVEGDFALTIAEKDVNVTTTTKVEVPKSADEKIETEVDFTISGAKGAPVDELVQVEEIDYSGLQNFRLEDEEHGDKVVYELKHIVDDKGSRYEFTKTKSYFRGWDQVFENGSYKLYEGKELYVGDYVEETVTSVLKEFNGAIDAAILAQGDCKDWYELSFATQGTVERKFYPNTTFIYTDNDYNAKRIVEKGDLDEERTKEYSTAGVQNYDFYYNPVIAKNEGESDNAVALKSQHNYVYTYTFKSNSHRCEDGVTVTRTCSGCGLSYSYDTKYCTWEYDEKTFDTMCGEDCIDVQTCKACGSKTVSYSGESTHNFINFKNQELTADMLTAQGLDANGFYYGRVESYICANCELQVYEYTWYTCNNGDCKKHTAVVASAPAHNDDDYAFDAVNVKEVGVSDGHYYITDQRVNANVTEKEKEEGFNLLPAAAKEIMKGYNQVAVEENKCKGCGRLQYKYYTFAINTTINGKTTTSKVCYIRVEYKNGEVDSFGYSIYDYDLTDVVAKAAEYGIAGVNAELPYGEIAYYYNNYGGEKTGYYVDKDSEFVINTPYYSEYRFIMRIYVNKVFTVKTANANFYDALNCKQINYTINVNAKTSEPHENEYHPYTTNGFVLTSGENCREGVRGKNESRCLTCGKVVYSYEDNRTWHNYTYNFESAVLSEYGEHLTDDYNVLNGLNARVYGYYCSICGCFTECTMTLTADWILSADVTIKAENFEIILNGHNIDLNGHELRIYAYAGTRIVISDAGNFDEGRIAFVDSKKDTDNAGLLVVFTDDGFIDFGSIGVDCEVFISDSDNLQTIDESVISGENNIADYVFSDDEPSETSIEEDYQNYLAWMAELGEEPMSFEEFVEEYYSNQDDEDEPTNPSKPDYPDKPEEPNYPDKPEEPEIPEDDEPNSPANNENSELIDGTIDYEDPRMAQLYEIYRDTTAEDEVMSYDEFYDNMSKSSVMIYEDYVIKMNDAGKTPLYYSEWLDLVFFDELFSMFEQAA